MKSRYVFAGIVVIALVLVTFGLLQVVSANDPGDETISWTGGGGTSDWGTASNWSPVRVPNTSDKVFIDSGSGVTISSGSQHVIWLHSHKPITISGGTLELDQASLIADNFTLDSAGTLTGAGNLDISGKFTWGWGTMSGAGVTNASGGIDLVVTSTGGKSLYRTLNNKSGSTATYVTGAAYFYIDAPGVFNNESGAIFNWQTSGGINNAGAVGTFNNAGTLNTTTSAYVAIPFNNTGTVNVTGGDLSLSGGGTHTGSFAVAAGRTLYFAGGTHALNTGGISGEGTARFSTTVNVADGVVLGNATIYGGTTTLTGDVTATSLGLDGAGTLTGTGDLAIGGLFTWGWGTMSGAGVTNASGGIDLVVTSTGGKSLYRTLNNKSGSTATYVTGAAYFYIDAPGVFNNESGAIFNWQTSGGGINNAGAVGIFNNAGTLNTTTSAYVAIPFNNTGTVNVTGGTLSLNNYVQTAGSIVLNGGSLYTSNPLDIQGGSLKGSGTITGNVSIGTLGGVEIVLGGTTPGNGAGHYEQLNILGNAALAGTLKVTLSAFTPAVGDTFTIIMTSGSCTGTFTTRNLPVLGGTLAWGPVAYNSGSIVLSVVAGSNHAPTAVNDAYSTNEDTPLNQAASGVLGNDTDSNGDPLTAVKVTDPGHGTVTLNANGSFTYTPAANYYGSDSFTYKANDGTTDSAVVTVTITVNSVNDAPAAPTGGVAYSTDENAVLNQAAPGVLGNATDIDGNALTATLVGDVSHGTLVLNANGSFTYTPAAGFTGSDSFTCKANDGTADSSVFTVTITVNQLPPTISSLDHLKAAPGETIRMVITGTKLGGATEVDFGPGVTTEGLTIDSATQITVDVKVGSDAQSGSRDVTVTTAQGVATLTGAFTIEKAPVQKAPSGGMPVWIWPVAALAVIVAGVGGFFLFFLLPRRKAKSS